MMAGEAQIRGMLLEEAILHLLRSCGYKAVQSAHGDSTLDDGPSGLEVRGRGSNHQIDAIADFLIHQPFSNPMRLLLEAKFTRNRTGIDVVRNAVGVLRDVSEYWVGRTGSNKRSTRNTRQRYHYQYAVFSASGFSRPTQDYAFAHDVYLLPLRENRFLKPIVQAVEECAEAVAEDEDDSLGDLRADIRHRLRVGAVGSDDRSRDVVDGAIHAFVKAVRQIDLALLAMIGNQFPVFLVPSPEVARHGISELSRNGPIQVRVFWDQRGWYLRRSGPDEEPLFSFDLPESLFLQYADGGILTPESAVRLKGQHFSRFQAFWITGRRLELLHFELDDAWLDDVRRQLGQRRTDT